MNKRALLVLIILIYSMFQCGKNETEDVETGLTQLPAVSEITFGKGWRATDSTVTDTGRTFSPTDTIRYQIKFDSVLVNWFMIKKAWKIILETGKTSTSYIQRRLRIGYNRAANIMEKLEEMGYLSPAIGNKPREILRRD